jgi:hypothetical protein
MKFTRWTNQGLPQTLQYGMFLLYFHAVLGVIFLSFLNPLGFVIVAGSAMAGLGIANEYRWGWRLGVAISVLGLLPAVLSLMLNGASILFDLNFLIAIVFPVAQFLLLVHPQSREHQRIWFS